MGFLNSKKDLGELEMANEQREVELSIAQKEELIRAAKKKYGPEWMKFFKDTKSGLDWNALKFRCQ